MCSSGRGRPACCSRSLGVFLYASPGRARAARLARGRRCGRPVLGRALCARAGAGRRLLGALGSWERAARRRASVRAVQHYAHGPTLRPCPCAHRRRGLTARGAGLAFSRTCPKAVLLRLSLPAGFSCTPSPASGRALSRGTDPRCRRARVRRPPALCRLSLCRCAAACFLRAMRAAHSCAAPSWRAWVGPDFQQPIMQFWQMPRCCGDTGREGCLSYMQAHFCSVFCLPRLAQALHV